MVDDSTEELLKGTVKRNDIESSDEDNAIEIDTSNNHIIGNNIHENDSTRALLLGQNNIHNFNFDNVLRTPDSPCYSSDDNDINNNMHNDFKALGISQNNENEINSLQYDTVLNDLYVSISQFLVRNQLSQAFITTFKKYVNNLIQDGKNPLKDKYILSIQTEIDQNDQLTPHLEHLISILLLEPQNLIMRLTHYQINFNHNLLKRNFLKWRILTNTNNYQSKLINLYENYIKNKFLIKWVQKYRYYKQNENIKSMKANDLRLKYMVFDKILYKFDSIDKMQQLADTQFLNHIFQRLKVKIVKMEQLTDDFNNKIIKPLLIKKYFEIWRLNGKLSTYRSIPTKRHIFNNWNKKLNNNENLVEIADIAKTNKLLDTKFNIWRTRSVKYTERLLDLQKSDGQVLKLKYFKKIIKNYKLLNTEEEFIINRNLMIKKFYFSRLLKKKFEDKLHYYSLMQIKNDNIRRKYFTILMKNFSQIINSTNFLMDSITRKYLRLWRLKYRQRATIKEKNLHEKKDLLMKWQQKFKYQKRYEIYEKESILRITFQKWKQKNKNRQEAIYRAQSYNNALLKRNNFKFWLNKTSINVDLYTTAYLFRNNHLFHTFVHKYEITKFKRTSCENENIKPITDHTLRVMFELWKERSETRRQSILNDKLHDFVYYRNDKLRRKYLTIIKKRYSLINQHFESRAQTLEKRNLGRLFFKSVIRKLEKSNQMTALALGSYELKLFRNYMETWIKKYDTNSQLEETLLNYLDENNIKVLSRYLGLWSVQSLKMERDNNSVRAFRRRWDRASIRGLLILWKEKHEQKYSSNDNVDVEQQSRVAVQTPGRVIAHHRDTIRGSATVRRNRMDARISRFKRAIPSPYKNEDNPIRGLSNDIVNPRPGQLQFSAMTDLKPQQSGRTPLRTSARKTSPHNIVDNERYLKGSPISRHN